jgi:hypothetical protein
LIEKKGSIQSLNNEWSKMVAENFKVNENQQKLVIEGVQPEVIVQEVLSARLDNVFKMILRNYDNDTP